jgi:hypothetical protein
MELDEIWKDIFQRYALGARWKNKEGSDSWRAPVVRIEDVWNVLSKSEEHDSRRMVCSLRGDRILEISAKFTNGRWKADLVCSRMLFESESPKFLPARAVDEEKAFVDLNSLSRDDKTDRGLVYFARINNDDQLVKIGFTRNLSKRWSKGRITDCPYTISVFASFAGWQAHEKILHRILKKSHFRGEWFLPSEDVLKIAELLNGKKLP